MRTKRIIFLLVAWMAYLQSWAGGGYTLSIGEWCTLEIAQKSVAIGFTLTEPVWTIEGASVAHVGDPKGYAHNVCAVRPGLSKVRCDYALVNKKVGIYTPMYDYWWITVWGTEPTGMSLSGPSTMVVGEKGRMLFQFTPDYERSSVVWTSSDPNIVTISREGIQLTDLLQAFEITAVDAGEATLTATSGNGLVKTWPIKVVLASMTLKASMESCYLEKGDLVELTASEVDAEIRYTTDGSEPSENSTLYEGPIAIEKTTTLWAKAFKKGYETPEFKGEYKVTPARTVKRFPMMDDLYFIYKDVNPYVEYESSISEGPQFSTAQVLCDDSVVVAGEFIINNKRLVFVPKEPLMLGHYYTINIEEGTVEASNGYPNKPTHWTFLTGNYVRSISAGYQQAAAVCTDNTLFYWGRNINSSEGGDKTIDTLYPSPKEMARDVYSVSCGFTHNLITKSDGKVYGWGMQFCGEVGNGSTSLLTTPAAISLQLSPASSHMIAGGQASAYVSDGKLWLAGRNDFGQVGDTAKIIYSLPVEYSIAGGVSKVVPGWQTTFALGNNKTLYGWGDNSNGLLYNSTESLCLKPQDLMTGVVAFDLSRWDNNNAAAITEDGALYVWGQNDHGQLGNGSTEPASKPVQIMRDIIRVSVGNRIMAAIDSDGALWTWGDNSYGQLGNGSTVQTSVPQKIMEGVVDIELGCNFAVALKADGSVWTWGQNSKSQLGANLNDAFITKPQQIIKERVSAELQEVQVLDATLRLGVGEKTVVCAKPVPLLADYHEWIWSTSNADVVTVDERGVITAVSKGTAIITLTSDNGKTAQCSVTVGDTFILGDVNGDGLVNVTDIVATVNFIMEKPSNNFNELAADLNGDGKVNVTDIVKMVTIIMSGDGASSRRAAATSSDLVISGNNIQLKNAEGYTAAQFDINLSDGESISNVVLNGSSNHSLYWKMIYENTYRVVVYSMTNAAFHVNSDDLFEILMTSGQDATISNEILIRAEKTTGIDAIRKEAENGKVYDLNGRQVKNPRKGVYIINGKKVLVK